MFEEQYRRDNDRLHAREELLMEIKKKAAASEPLRTRRAFMRYGAIAAALLLVIGGTAGLLLAAVVYSLLIGDRYRLAALATAASYGLALLLSLTLMEFAIGLNNISLSFAADSPLNFWCGLICLLLGICLLSGSRRVWKMSRKIAKERNIRE